MSLDGGFGVVAYVRDTLVNDVLAAAHYRYADSFRAVVGTTINLDGEAISVSRQFYVDAPTISLRRADERARVSLTGWARVQLNQKGGQVNESALVRLDAVVLAPLVLEAEKVSFREMVYLDLSNFDVVSAQLTLVWLSPMPGLKAPALVLSEKFRNLLVDAIRPMAKKYLRVNVPVDKIDQMRLTLTVNLVFTPRIWPIAIGVLDGAFAVGFDVRDGDKFTTRGDIKLLQLPWERWATSLNAHRKAGNMQGYARESDGSVLVVMTAPLVLQYGGWTIDLQLKLHSTENRRFGDTTLALAPGAIVLNTKVTQAQDWPLA
ncbi:hypothetical protein CQY20_33715 [Mycolicibacterium agri]|uniref:Uncharacterized protein n=1 Tax=Mycolicibacterium agri TaxID=36811 RepID=A0A2A7MMU9_MYCAG|nr:hypothetical protein [Mycolicibacterium agri]PEG32909.1 hypothetical protein CQY20_33715 [Mycolicibacterium agri]GFG50122.1 hypothetical protein MAGR_15630 [Mycolicibacterium agri]